MSQELDEIFDKAHLDCERAEVVSLTESNLLDVDLQGVSGSKPIIKPLIDVTITYLGFDKIHQDQKFIDKGLGKEGPPAGIADTGGSTDSSGSKWSLLYENPEGLSSYSYSEHSSEPKQVDKTRS